ncbi:non-structural maintenance of chromosomes element 1 homolog isoform X3 [Lampris incognitus]|uniref:non-structural maintenance of chromosomes element 1 homolog isoform X3 n=1 Tax=Lampris incognitus TaxID=2546036 RepID=UPI0024B585F4|nr:non-structural maintenance of chromosomes element 1 homolog isoform X3 [Lampris incognitus]
MTQPMGDSHRRFLQTMMAHGIIDKMMARSLHKHCCEIHKAQYAHDRLDEFIGVINSRLQPMFMQIRKGISEDNGFEYYALVNLANTDVTKMSSDYADNELELFQKIKQGNYTLTTRCIIDMDHFIRTVYADRVKMCSICRSIALQGQLCENPTCDIKIHKPCVARYFKDKEDPRCPACDEFWPHEIPEVGQSQSQPR